jgi:hypothetical protein
LRRGIKYDKFAGMLRRQKSAGQEETNSEHG